MPHIPGSISGLTTTADDTESVIMKLSRQLEPRETDSRLVADVLKGLDQISERSPNRTLSQRADMAASLLRNGPVDDT